jgi:glucokinase
VADVGGTHVRFAVAAPQADGRWTLAGFTKSPGDDHADFAAALAAYADAHALAPNAAIAVAGPIADGAVQLTNRAWRLAAKELEGRFGFGRVALVNDFAALALGAAQAGAESFAPLRAGEALAGAPMLAAGPGTGFGMALLTPDAAGRWQVLPGEGGHAAYAARTDFEHETAKRLAQRFGYVSVEMMTSGRWFQEALTAASEAYGRAAPPAATPASILSAGEGGDAFAAAYCRLRARAILGACGDACLIAGARGGVILAGGVAQGLAAWFARDDVADAFSERGPMRSYLARTPIRLLRDETAALLGAAEIFLQTVAD